MNIIDYPQN